MYKSMAKFGIKAIVGSDDKKRDAKAANKEQEKQDKLEEESQRSGQSNNSGVSRSTNGRFEGAT